MKDYRKIEERADLGVFKVYRKSVAGTLDFERETLHVSDDTKKIVSVETKTKENATSIQNPVPSIRYQYDNHLGSSTLELDHSAALISYEEYHPFGTTSYRSGSTENEVSMKRYKYVGKERDEETGLYYYGARYYAAWLCRFVSVDPLQFDYPQLTPYNYAGNKPISYIDLDGLEEFKSNIMLPPTITPKNNQYHPPADNTRIVRPPQSFSSEESSPSRIQQAFNGIINTTVGLSIAITGLAIAATTGITVAGAVGGVVMSMAGFSQMAIGLSQVVDAAASKEQHVAPVSGVGELVGYEFSEKTGNPYYRAIGAGFDVGSSVGFGSTKLIPVISNVKELYQCASKFNKIEPYRKTAELYSEINTIGTNLGLLLNPDIQDDNANIGNTIISIESSERFHTIYPGETLTSISKQYDVSIDDLINLNNIEDPNLIYSGEELKVHESTTINIIQN